MTLHDPRVAFAQHSDVEAHTEVVVTLGHSFAAGKILNMPFFKCNGTGVT